MGAGFDMRRSSRERAFRIQEIGSFQDTAAAFADIAILVSNAAERTSSPNITVRKRSFAFRAINDIHVFDVDKSFFLQLGKKVFRQFFIFFGMSLMKIIKGDQKRSGIFLMLFPVLIYKFFRFHARFFSIYLYRRTMHVRSADV